MKDSQLHHLAGYGAILVSFILTSTNDIFGSWILIGLGWFEFILSVLMRREERKVGIK